MASVADIGVESGPTQIDRLNRARQVTIILNLPPGTALGDADARADEIVADFPPPAGMTIQKEGMARRLGDTSSAIIAAFVLALIALYIVLASQFDRFAQPLLIMLTAPLTGRSLEVVAVFDAAAASAAEFGLKLRVGNGQETLVGYDAASGEAFVDRTASGFSPSEAFAARHGAPLEVMEDGTVKLHIFLGLIITMLFPFTRLVHIWSGFAAPFRYLLTRPGYQIVRSRRRRPLEERRRAFDARQGKTGPSATTPAE